jgi:hypothetical protein
MGYNGNVGALSTGSQTLQQLGRFGGKGIFPGRNGQRRGAQGPGMGYPGMGPGRVGAPTGAAAGGNVITTIRIQQTLTLER